MTLKQLKKTISYGWKGMEREINSFILMNSNDINMEDRRNTKYQANRLITNNITILSIYHI